MTSTANGLIYLDNATTSWPKPDQVYAFMLDFYRRCGVTPGRSDSAKANEAAGIIENVRRGLTAFFGGDEDAPERLCFSANATDALNLIIQGLLSPGDHVVATALEHNSVIRPINHLVRDAGVQATFVPFGGRGFVEPDDIRSAIRANTKLVIVNHASNVLGTVQPVGEIGRVCKEHGVLFAIDSSQTAGVIPIDMKEMNIDVLAFTGHKSLMGSTGIGGLYVRKRVDIRITRSGGTGIRSEDPYHLEEYPYRLEYGTPNLLGIASLWAGLQWLEETGGASRVHAHEMALTRRLVDGFRQVDGVIIYHCEDLDDHTPVVSINIDGMSAPRVGSILDTHYHIATRAGLHCAPLVHEQMGTMPLQGSVRFAVGPFNTIHDMDAAIEAVSHIAAEARLKASRVDSSQS
ncbi:MAG TPA: aminotransferase class V-fold PLP-dependent enzyme [Acidobacteriota bacterium]|nr:aminotransferase class V-fold PLP-dependent enzyme [Acidobacteriota bacterium]